MAAPVAAAGAHAKRCATACQHADIACEAVVQLCLPATPQCCMLRLYCCICRSLRLQGLKPLGWLAGRGSLRRSGAAFGKLAVVQH